MATVTPDTSPAELLRRFRGAVADARLTYPERAAVDVEDDTGGKWHLTTWWAEYSPADPERLRGKTVVEADLGERPGQLTVGFSDGTAFTVTPVVDETKDAIQSWELFTPEGLVLSYGPFGRWSLGHASKSS